MSDWLGGFFENKGAARLVTYDGENFRDAAGNAISVSGSGESNTATSVGAGGIAVVNGKVGVDLQFRSIIAKSDKVAVTLDATDKEVEIDVTEANLDLANIGGAIDLSGAQATGTIAAARMPAHTGDVTNSAGNLALTIGDDKVTNAKLADMAAQTIKVNATDALANPTDLALAVSTVAGRGPTGNIDDLAVQAGLVITNSSLGRAAITGDVTIGQDDNTSVIGAGKILTAMIGANQVSNAKLGTMNTQTIKANTTGSTGDCQNATISGGLSMVTGTPGVIKSKGSFGFPCTFSTTTTMSDPGVDTVRFNNATLSSVTAIAMSSTNGSRDISGILGGIVGGSISFMSNNSSGTSFAVFDVTAFDDNGTGEFYTLTVDPMTGVGILPSNAEEMQMVFSPAGGAGLTEQDVLDMEVVRKDANGQLIDKDGVVISGSPSVADYDALVALDDADYDGFAVNVQSGLNNSFWAGNGTQFTPLNGQYVQERSTIPGNFYIGGNNVTWISANVGGKVQVTSSGVHGITQTGVYLYVLSGGTGWTAGSSHLIDSIVSTTVIELNTAYSGHSGVPVFARAGTVTANSEIPHRLITLPSLRANTEVEVAYEIEYAGTLNATDSKIVRLYLESTVLNNYSNAAANKFYPVRHGFTNQGDASLQRALVGDNSSGYAASTLAPLPTAPATIAIATGTAGKTIKIAILVETVNIAARVNSYKCIIRG